ncbi:MAG TPA: amino acid adenylation domain-containing protein [Longimicrobium sp.]|nr:amino acid adenylation domain-containing protein [Longimicrobium sp.]
MGGHSLLGMQVLSRVRQRWGTELPVRVVFDAPTVAGLAARIDAARGRPAAPQPPLRPVVRGGPLPLSYAQQRLWFLHQMEPENPFYNIPAAVRLSGTLDADALRHALREIVHRHEALRTTFLATADGSAQVVHPAPHDFDLPFHDFSRLPHPQAEEEAMRVARAEAETPFDLARDRMLRAVLVRLAAGEHLLVLNLHHVAGDGWSIGVLFRELAALYEAFAAGRPSPLPAPPVQYADFAVWQREWLREEVLEDQLAYWRGRLAGAPAVLELPTDRARPAVQSYRGEVVPFEVPAELTARLHQAARREGATLFMVLLAGFDLLIHRLSGRDDVVVGSPIAGRVRREVEGLIGFFVNTMALRADLSGDPTVAELIGRVREGTLEAYAHQDLPFERVVEELQPERTLNRNPLFQVAFALQNVAMEPVDAPGLRLKLEDVDSGTSKFDMFLEMLEDGPSLRGNLEYATDLWERATVERMIALFIRLLDALAGDPSLPVSRARLLEDADAIAQVRDWNHTARPYPRDASIHAVFRERALATPNAVALEWVGGKMTYAELDARSNRLAHHLIDLGVRPDQPVALAAERSAAVVVALLAILKAGGAYVPINPKYPRSRIALMLDDSGARVLVTESALEDALPAHKLATVLLDDDALRIAAHPPHPPAVEVTADSAAYVMYTSGSTGRPKGVIVPHRAVLRLVLNSDFARFGSDEVWLQLAPIAFDASTLELWAPLLNGGRLALYPPVPVDPAELGGFIRRHGVTSAWLTAGLFHQMVDTSPETIGGLHQLLAGGDVLSVGHVGRVLEAFPHVRLINGYGPTENTTFSCCRTIVAADAGRATIPIGGPIANSTAYVLDANLLPAGPDVPGELFVGGDGVARGYLKAPTLTAERYLPDPFAERAGTRMYRTGDRVRRRPDGSIEFLGRIDEQVKIRGYRIEPGEVEAVLERSPLVATAVVHVREDVPGDKRLVAYVIPARPDAVAEVAEAAAETADRQVSQWESLFDDVYTGSRGTEEGDETFDIVGWNSSYTGQPIPPEEMREWVERTVERILALHPRKVLELGVGTGLLLFRVAPGSTEYLGTDFSAQVLARLEGRLRGAEGFPPVRLLQREAADFGGIEERRFDTAILNSVCQYFPTADYFADVVRNTVGALADGGAFFVGDVRNRWTLEAFRTAVEFDAAPGSVRTDELRQRCRRIVEEEEELLVEPDFFRALQARIPRVSRVEARVKRGAFHNELTRHRFDVVVHVGPAVERETASSVDWEGEELTLEMLRERLEGAPDEPLAVLGIPDARLWRELRIVELLAMEEGPETVAETRAVLAGMPSPAIDPEALWALGESLGLVVEIRHAGPHAPGAVDALFRRTERAAAFPERPLLQKEPREYANDPLWAAQARDLAPTLRAWVKEQLPEHMVPSALVVMDAFPLTPNGKVDRRALPAPEPQRLGTEEACVEPRTATETTLAAIWAEVLRLERVFVDDNFFDLGGHSLLATQLATRVREAFSIELPLQRVFEAPTVAALAAVVDATHDDALGALLDELDALSDDEVRALLEAGGAFAGAAAQREGTADVSGRLRELSPERRALLVMRRRMQEAQASGPELRRRPRPGGTAPLSYAQARLWVLDRMDPGSAAYNMPHPLRIRGALDASALARALDALRARHETLRTTFEERDGGPVQVIHPPEARPLPVADLSDLSADAREAEVRRRMDDDANTGFDLVRGPLIRAELLRLADDEHVLLLCMHHIVSDGWSMGVFARELGTLYAAFRDGREPHLAPLPVQYADFAAWQHEALAGETLDRLAAFWRAALDGAPPALELPTDRIRPAAESHRGRTLKTRIAPAAAARLREFARAEGATLFNVLTAAFRAALARHSGQDDVVLGTPVANRQRSELEGLVGFFVNTLPLRARVDAGQGFRALVQREKQVALAAFNHQDLPFDRMVEALKLPRDPARNPVFQAMVTLQNAGGDPVALGGVEITPLAPEYHTAKFDLTLDNYEDDDGSLRVEAEWATDLFDASTIDRIVQHFHALAEEGVAQPDRPLALLPGAAEDERAFVVQGPGSRVVAEYERASSIHALFAAQAARTPDAAAVEFGTARLSYAELDARANALAARLRAAGVGPGGRVGVSMERSAELVVAMLGALKAGAAYVPLDPSYPAERLAFMRDDAGVGALVVRGDVPDALAAFGGPTIALSVDDAIDGAASTDSVDVPAEALAYIVYTSGSTGTPKGIGIPHRGVVRLVRNTNYVSFTADERIAQISNASFDAITFEVWGALLNGGAVVGIDRDTVLAPDRLADALRDERITTAFVTTALFNQVARLRPDGFGVLRNLLFGGEAVDPAAVRAVLHAGAPGRLLHVYGPTESTTYATWRHVEDVPENAATLPIGIPLANTSAYVLDGLRVCNVGEPGELCLGGDGLAWGYLRRPATTAEQFVPDHLSGTPGARLYRTGDRVRRLDDGAVGFLSRIDQQVKVRGFRIEPAEIEVALRALPRVREASVMVRADGGEKRLVAYVVPSDGATPSPAELRDALAGRLPDYMVPTAFVALVAIPLTPNGKVDYRALPAPGAAAADEHVPPRTQTEASLAALWAQVLGVDRVSVEDDFFLLGGHSLLATQVVSRVRQAFGAELPLRAVFEASTVRRLAARLDALRGTAGPALPPVLPVDRTGALPVSFAQERMWFLERLEPAAGVYNMPVRIRLRGPLDTEALRRALELVIHRHEALRTVVREEGDAPVQRILPPAPFDLPLIVEGDAKESARVLDEAAWTPIDLENGPATRAILVREGDGEHVLALTIHHAQADGWALGIILREASAAYEAYAAGREPQLPPVDLQYGDFGVWQRANLAGERLDREAEWWRGRLAGAPPLLELPTDRPRPPRQSYRGAALPLRLEPELVRRLKTLAAREGATTFMALLAGFAALLGRLSRQEDVVVGTPVAGRNRAETEGIVGLFVNTLALRADLSGDPTFRALLRQVRETALGAYAHQDVPFEKLVELLRVERSLSHAPVFQVMFALQSQETGTLHLPGVEAEYDELALRAAKFDLSVSLEETADGAVEGSMEYATDLWDAETVARLGTGYALLLEALVADPDARVAAADALAPGEHDTLAAWSDGGPHADPVPGHVLFERQAARTPDAVAIAFESTEISYTELDRRANQLARHLRTLGVGLETLVGIMLERGPDQVAAVLAIWKAGGAYLPIDPVYPAERRAYMLADSGAAVLLTRANLAEGMETAGARVVDVGDAWKAAERLQDGPLGIGVDPLDLAYVIYTSGSTGRPKGTMNPHLALANLAASQRESFRVEPGTRVLQFASFSFDAAVADIVDAFANGGTLVMAPQEALAPGRPLLETLERQRVNAAMLPPSLWALLPDGGLPDLRVAISAGEACPPEVAARWSRGRRLVNAYGPTEAAVCSTLGIVEDAPRRVPLGRPMRGIRVHVLDHALREAGIGVPGEICVGGIGVGRGYLGRPGLTADRFVPDPVSEVGGARMYRTGDLGRWLPDGRLDYLGRLDHQVKLRGFRVELGEVEAALAGLPGVREALALVRPSPAGDPRLVAWAIPAEGAAPEPTPLRAALRRTLPEHMVPGEIVILSSWPLTPNGKIDRAALPAPTWGAGHAHDEPPRTPTEEMLAAVWREVLGVPKVARGDGFFALGGHSLLATRAVSRIRAVLGVEVPLRELFDAPTLEALAAHIDGERMRDEGLTDDPIVPIPRDGPLPLSSQQERLWFVQRMAPESTAFNMPMSLRLGGALDVDALRRALGEIVRRHEPLRTVFARGADGPVQVVHPEGDVHLPFTDLEGRADAGDELKRMMDERARVPFDLERGPLLRLHLVRLHAEEHCLLVDMHHAVSDGWSMERFHAELATLYDAFRAGEPSPLPELPVQYADYAAWQRRWLRGERLAAQVAFWKEKLEGAPTVALPLDRPRPASPVLEGDDLEFTLPRALADRVEAIGRELGATPYMTFLAAFTALIHRWTGQTDLVLGTAVSGRGRPEVEPMIGFFVNALALRMDAGGDPGFRELLRRVRATTLEAYAHQDVPFERVLEEVKVERRLSMHPLTQVSFTLQHEAPLPEAPGLVITPGDEGGDTGTAKVDLTLGIVRGEGDLRCTLEYASTLFDRETIQRVAERFRAFLEAAAERPDAPLSALSSWMDAAERDRILREWSGTDHPWPRRLIHQMVADQAARTPAAVALKRGAAEITYAELDAGANRLAHHLAALGVGPETRVGVVADRSPGMLAAVLGVLKAGGAYVPLDPAYPAERVRWMLEDSGIRVLVSASAASAAALPLDGVQLVALDRDADAIAARPSCDPAVPVGEDHLAYVIYTSGSTGLPKGVLVPHRGIPNLVNAQVRRFGVDSTSRVLQFASLSFDASVSEVFSSLSAGATLVLASREELLPGEPLLQLLRRERITKATLPPSVLATLHDAELPGLRTLVSAGEAVSAAVVARWAPGRAFHNAYGPTENTVGIASNLCHPDARVPAIGRPFENVRAYVLDEGMQPVAAGFPGEVYAGGPGVTRGYHGRPGLTAEKFVPDPFGGLAGARLYRTGDRARWRPDGTLEFMGRGDQQLKVRGYRVEPGEIVARLSNQPGVRDALVMVREDGGTERLVAWVLAAAGAAPDPERMREELKKHLPEYMVPAAVVVVDEIPLTPNGKVDRARLPAPDFSASAAEEQLPPQGELEGVVSGAWCQVLGVERVGMNANFFDIGGHSLLLAQLQEKLEAALGRAIPLVDLFRYPTVRSFAARLGGEAAVATPAGAPAQSEAPKPEGAKRGEDRGAARLAAIRRR